MRTLRTAIGTQESLPQRSCMAGGMDFGKKKPLPNPFLKEREGNKDLVEVKRILLDPSEGNFGCVVPAGVWHTVEVLEPSVIYEAKDGRYGEDGSEIALVQFGGEEI